MEIYDYNEMLNSIHSEIEIYAECAKKEKHKNFIKKLNQQLDEIEKEKGKEVIILNDKIWKPSVLLHQMR